MVGGAPVHVELDFSENGWSLDIQKLFAAVTPKTRVIFINSPSNPLGWAASREQLREILNFARHNGIWIIADEVYSRFVYESERAPSFYDVIEDDDRVIFVNTFSKNWAMTGWRAGWISAPEELGQMIENLIQYSTSGVASFIQRGAIAALQGGEDFIAMQQSRARQNRDVICAGLRSTGKARLAVPDGAFYLFFKIDGYSDSKALAMKLIDEAKVGVAPGTGFYTGGAEYLRICYLRDPEQIEIATNRLVECIGSL